MHYANAVKNINIPNYENFDYLAGSIDDPTLKAISKLRNHPSILAIASEYKKEQTFFKNFDSKEDISTKRKVFDVSKAIQQSDIPVKIIKTNGNVFQNHFAFILKNY